MSDAEPVPSTPEDESPAWHLYAEVLETVSNALLALAVWGAAAAVVATLLSLLVGGWPVLLVLPVAALGAGLSLRSRALQLRERTRRRATVG